MHIKNNTVVLGLQWGDEGKGKVVDLLTETASVVTRFQGGNNAGHTLIIDDRVTKLHLIPSGILHDNVHCLIGNGVVLSLSALMDEIESLNEQGVDLSGRLYISEQCTLILPYHIALDYAREESKQKNNIGTTLRGIGPSYEDKVARRAIKLADVFNRDKFFSKLKDNVEYYNFLLEKFYKANPVDLQDIYQNTLELAAKIQSCICDSGLLLRQAHKDNKPILFEGAQGSLLDIDYGTYPFVTSSNTTIGAVYTGTGFSLAKDTYVLGIAKAYLTRVGSGPFPTELDNDDIGDYLSTKGREFGTTTGRARRTGWLDVVALKYAVDLNGVTGLCLTKLDVLDGLEKISICVGYKCNDTTINYFPAGDVEMLQNCEPIYEELEGWQESTAKCTEYVKLPQAAQQYIKRIEDLIGVSVDFISTGPDRKDMVFRNV
jgi:adenylosuccinate synthase